MLTRRSATAAGGWYGARNSSVAAAVGSCCVDMVEWLVGRGIGGEEGGALEVAAVTCQGGPDRRRSEACMRAVRYANLNTI